jgi:transmembrane sensor
MTLEMKSIEETSGPSAQALAWLVHLKSGAATTDDLAAFGAWRGADPANETAYRDSLLTWRMLGPAFARAAPAPVPERGSRPSFGAMAFSRRQMLAGAGVAAAAVAVAPLAVNLLALPAGATVLETRKGERRRDVLPDGVVVELNTDSRLISWTAKGVREVRLDHGEALLSVDFGAEQHLRATAGDAEILAERARFLLSWFGTGEPRILCVGGAVEVRSGGRSFRLAADQAVDPAAGSVSREAHADVAGALEWRRGVLAFEARRAADVIAELNRYRDGQVFLPASHAHVKISGVIHLDRADAAVEHIARSLDMKATRLPFGIVILRR